jgi:hypothetical protein
MPAGRDTVLGLLRAAPPQTTFRRILKRLIGDDDARRRAVTVEVMNLFGRRRPPERDRTDTPPAPGSLQTAEFSTVEELVSSIRAYVTAPDKVSAATSQNAPPVLPDLIMVTAVLMGDQVNFLPYSTVVELVGDPQAMWQIARLSVQNLDGIQVLRETVVADRDDTDVVTLVADDPFVASRVVVLDWLVEQLFEEPAEHGVLVALPSRERLAVHRIGGAGVIPVLHTLLEGTNILFTQAGPVSRISPHLYLVQPDGRTERITDQYGERQFAIDFTGLLGEVLLAPPPAGLGLDAGSF